MKYILDVDRTLFDTERFKIDSAPYSEEGLWTTPRIWDILNPNDYLFPDVVPFLSELDNAEVSILTVVRPYLGPEGEAFQRGKVELTEIKDKYSHSVFMDGEKGPYIADMYDGNPTVFIDDEREQINSVKSLYPDIICMQMVRSNPVNIEVGSEKTESSKQDSVHVVKNFDEVKEVLKSYE